MIQFQPHSSAQYYTTPLDPTADRVPRSGSKMRMDKAARAAQAHLSRLSFRLHNYFSIQSYLSARIPRTRDLLGRSGRQGARSHLNASRTTALRLFFFLQELYRDRCVPIALGGDLLPPEPIDTEPPRYAPVWNVDWMTAHAIICANPVCVTSGCTVFCLPDVMDDLCLKLAWWNRWAINLIYFLQPLLPPSFTLECVSLKSLDRLRWSCHCCNLQISPVFCSFLNPAFSNLSYAVGNSIRHHGSPLAARL